MSDECKYDHFLITEIESRENAGKLFKDGRFATDSLYVLVNEDPPSIEQFICPYKLREYCFYRITWGDALVFVSAFYEYYKLKVFVGEWKEEHGLKGESGIDPDDSEFPLFK